VTGRVDLGCGAERAERRGDTVETVVDGNGRAEEANSKGIATDIHVVATNLGACGVVTVEEFRNALSHHGCGEHPASAIDGCRDDDEYAEQDDFSRHSCLTGLG